MAGARPGRARLRQRHHAADHAADGAIARHHQVEPESDACKQIDAVLLNTIAACGDVNRNVMCNPNPYPSRARMRRRIELARAISDHLTAAHAGLSRDLARRREDRRRRGRGGRADLRQDLSAAQIQDRGGGAAVERRRRLRARSRLHRHPRRQGRGRRLECHRRRRHGHDPWRAGHLSAHRRRDGLLRDAGCGGARRGRCHRAARLGRPHQPQACAAEIHHRGPRARCFPRRGRAPRRRQARAAASPSRSPRPATATAGPKATTAAAISRCSCRTAAADRRRRADVGAARDRADPRRRFPHHPQSKSDHRQCCRPASRREIEAIAREPGCWRRGRACAATPWPAWRCRPAVSRSPKASAICPI